jgi:cyclohexa-1,5-dienecarbonyl-CoA hydratase
MSDGPLRLDVIEEGAVWRLTLGGLRGNVLDGALMRALTDAFRRARAERQIKAITIEGQGAHFSFGASVQEHLPGQAAGMLATFDETLTALLDAEVPVVAVVRGQCLGGALELVSLCHRVVAAPDAKLGQPEIVLGVFAPVASVVLPMRVGQGAADDLCLSGRSIDAREAHRIGLVDEIADAPWDAALGYIRQHLLPRSGSSLRLAVRAVRRALRARIAADLPAIERLYLDELMSTADAQEGLQAFLDKRTPSWGNR